MNYEQKYKEALGWMKEVYPTLSGADKEDAEQGTDEMFKKLGRLCWRRRCT